MICNNRFDGELTGTIDWVKLEEDLDQRFPIYQADLLDVENPWRHDSTKLANTINDLYMEKTGPLLTKEDTPTTELKP